MSMRTGTTVIAGCIALVPRLLWSQTPAPPPAPPKEIISFQSATDVSAMIAKAEAARKTAGAAPIGGSTLLNLPPYTANLEYRTAPGNIAIHEKEAELFVVLDGSGTVVLGGKSVGEGAAKKVEGGTERKLAKGDIFIVPENTVHWFNTINNALVLMSMHVPRSPASTAQ